MNEQRPQTGSPSRGKILTAAYVAAAAFTAISILVPILWERMTRKEQR